MDLQAVDGGSIPGIHQLLTRHDFELAGNIYNKDLPEDNTLIEAEETIKEHLPELRVLFQSFRVENVFGVNALHKHDTIPDGYHMAGQTAIRDERLYYATKPVGDTLDSDGVCGLKYRCDTDRLRPYEFHKAPLPSTISEVDPNFFPRFIEYLVMHNLTSIMGLMYIPEEMLKYDWIEFVGPNGVTIQAPIQEHDIATAVTTGWRFPQPNITRKSYCVPNPDTTHPPPKSDLLERYQLTTSDINYGFVKSRPKLDET